MCGSSSSGRAPWGPGIWSAGEQAAVAALPKISVSPDGRGFVTAEGKPFVPLGVNYFRPGTGWAPKVWKQFDAEATRRDFALMKDLGVNCVRVFLTYGSFFTSPDRLDPEGLAKLDQFLQIAEETGIYVHPTGPDHWEGIPAWVPRDRIADSQMLEAIGAVLAASRGALSRPTRALRLRLVERTCGSVGYARDARPVEPVAPDTVCRRQSPSPKPGMSRPGEIRWGEVEPPSDREPPGSRRLLDYQRFREQIADQWTARQVAAIKKADPAALVTVGMIQWSVPVILPSVQQYAAFRPARQAPMLDFLEIHFYPLATGFYEYKPDDELQNLAYLQSVVRETAAHDKPVVVAEFGWYGGGKLTIDNGRHPPASEDDQARWCRGAVEATAGLATGWLNWGLYDHPEARDVTELTGLLTSGGQPKSWAREFQKLAARFAQQPVPQREPAPGPRLDWDRAITDPQVGREFLRAVHDSSSAIARDKDVGVVARRRRCHP